MRTIVAIAFALAAALLMNNSLAAEPQVKQAQEKPAQAKTAAKDTNYRFHNGQWFYWMPQSKRWKVWDGHQWNDFQSVQTRTFSYEAPAAAQFDSAYRGTYQTFGGTYSNYPYTNNRIIGSYGFRGAGSKAEGRY